MNYWGIYGGFMGDLVGKSWNLKPLLPRSSSSLVSSSDTVLMRLLLYLQRSAPTSLQSLSICPDVSWSRPYSPPASSLMS